MSTRPEQRTIDVDVAGASTPEVGPCTATRPSTASSADDLGGFRETIAPGAFAERPRRRRALPAQSRPGRSLGRDPLGTLRLADEQRGLRFECDLPDSPLGENVREAVDRGDIDGASFRFEVGEESWNGDAGPSTRSRSFTT